MAEVGVVLELIDRLRGYRDGARLRAGTMNEEAREKFLGMEETWKEILEKFDKLTQDPKSMSDKQLDNFVVTLGEQREGYLALRPPT